MWLRVFDFYVRRFFAVAAMIVGLILVLVDMPALLPGHKINVNGVPSSDWFSRLFGVVMPLLVVLFGRWLFRLKPIYPSKSDSDQEQP